MAMLKELGYRKGLWDSAFPCKEKSGNAVKKKGIFITGTGTDVGKTYVTGMLVRQLRELGINAGYYKAAISGAETVAESDAGYVNQAAGIGQDENTLLSYLYKTPVSPHLAAQMEGNPVDLYKVKKDFARVAEAYEYVVMEGSGGIVCPIRYDETAHLLLEDIILELGLDTLIVGDAGLGTINALVLTVEYMKHRKIKIRGIILNRYTDSDMEKDNRKMIEALTGIPVLAVAAPGADRMELDSEAMKKILEVD
ncbi:dethiobiotin synthase [Lachnospiraceae bacterium 62-35]